MSLDRLEHAVDELREGQQTMLREMGTLMSKVDSLERTVGGNGGPPLRDRVVAIEARTGAIEATKAASWLMWVAIVGACATGAVSLIVGVALLYIHR